MLACAAEHFQHAEGRTFDSDAALTHEARMVGVADLLVAVARLHAANEAHACDLARTAMQRLLAHDPELAHFWRIVAVLRDELAADEPRRAYCVAGA